MVPFSLPIQAEGDVGKDAASRVVGEEGIQALASDAQRRDCPAVRALFPERGRAIALRSGGKTYTNNERKMLVRPYTHATGYTVHTAQQALLRRLGIYLQSL